MSFKYFYLALILPNRFLILVFLTTLRHHSAEVKDACLELLLIM